MRRRKWIISVLIGFARLIFGKHRRFGGRRRKRDERIDAELAVAQRGIDVSIRGEGRVIKLLPDDNVGIRHQRFLVALPSRAVVLIVHNIDLSRRIEPLEEGDSVAFEGEYRWNEKGGFVHWTHRDPAGWHAEGWIRRVVREGAAQRKGRKAVYLTSQTRSISMRKASALPSPARSCTRDRVRPG